jgi:hypothetical protein
MRVLIKLSHFRPIRDMTLYEISDFSAIKDLSSLFNWNTKQLFVYLEAEYSNAKGVSKHRLYGYSMIVPRSGTITRHEYNVGEYALIVGRAYRLCQRNQ